MEEKKTKWYYTTGGKMFRGFLCLVTFAVLVAGAEFIVMSEAQYGGSVFSPNAEKDYHATTSYAGDVLSGYNKVLSDVARLQRKEENSELRVIDVANGEICNYKLPTEYLEEYPEDIVDMEEYLEDQEEESVDFTDYDAVYEILTKEKNSYIYFDKQSFRKLFVKCGSRNRDYRYSDGFPEESYFVFVENSELDLGYAVYDAVNNVYYSTEDAFFTPYDSYLYSCQEVLDSISNYKEEYGKTPGNIILSLLATTNYQWGTLVSDKIGGSSPVWEAEDELAAMEDGAFRYYIITPDKIYDNVDGDLSQVTGLAYSYLMRGDNYDDYLEKTGKYITTLAGHDEENLRYIITENFPDEDVAIYFGMDYYSSAVNHSEDELYQRYSMYNVVSEVGFYVVIATVLAFVLLVIQAVWLLKTTGRREKSVAVKKKKRGKNAENAEPDAGDVREVPAAEIQLYRFDKLPTDIWFVSAFVILFSAIVCGFALIAENVTEFMLFKNMALCVLGTLPFGFCFMIFTLSFARRIKAKNLRGHFAIGTGLKWFGRKLSGLLKKCKVFYYKIDVEMRIFISCISYLVIIMFCVIAIELLRYDASLVLFFMLVIVVLTVWAARRLRRICKDLKSINSCMDKIREGDLDCKCQIDSENSLFAQVADGINHLGDGLKAAVELSLKDERMKTELITNVSHDLKTPLTSIINYVDLLKKEDIPGEDAKHYLEVLDAKSQRLKQLTEDLVEAAKANSGNIELECMPLAFDELMRQAIGEFEDKFATRNLTVVASYPEAPAVIMGDGRRIYRIIENLLQNAYKYALEGTRIYADLSNHGGEVAFTLKNVSAAQLNISPEELMERFTRGDESRTTEGSGLGLSIAKDLTKLMDGSFEILLDGDLFKVIVTFPEYVKEGDGEN